MDCPKNGEQFTYMAFKYIFLKPTWFTGESRVVPSLCSRACDGDLSERMIVSEHMISITIDSSRASHYCLVVCSLQSLDQR